MNDRDQGSGTRDQGSAGMLRFGGRIDALSGEQMRALCERTTSADDDVRRHTAEIVRRVRAEGDAALVAMALDFDRAELRELEVERVRWQAALDALDPALRAAMERAAGNIDAAHRAFLPQAVEVETEPGVVVGRRPDPLARVGVYAPGGRAAYPSSVLMGVVPARVAGVMKHVSERLSSRASACISSSERPAPPSSARSAATNTASGLPSSMRHRISRSSRIAAASYSRTPCSSTTLRDEPTMPMS